MVLQLERSRGECEDLGREVRRREQEVERAQQEKVLEIDRVRAGWVLRVCVQVLCLLFVCLFVVVFLFVVCLFACMLVCYIIAYLFSLCVHCVWLQYCLFVVAAFE